MPLVTITCDNVWFPPEDLDTASQSQVIVALIAGQLPDLLTEEETSPLLAGAPPEAVQVDFRRFHSLAINAPNIWVEVRFTEDYWSEDERVGLRESVAATLTKRFEDHELTPTWALDLFFGPGHGCYVENNSQVLMEW